MKEVIAYPPGSKWWRCLACGFRFFGYPLSFACPQPECRGTIHEDWHNDDDGG